MFILFLTFRVILNLSFKELMSLFQIQQIWQWPKNLILDDIQETVGKKEVGYISTLHSIHIGHWECHWNQIFKIQQGYNDPHIIINKLSALKNH